MNLQELSAQFDEHEGRQDGNEIAVQLTNGLDLLSDLLFTRVHADVERHLGMDSMLTPLSELKSEMVARNEIDCFCVAEAALAARDHAFVRDEGQWFLNWLAALKMGTAASTPGVAAGLNSYWNDPADQRRLRFSNRLERVVPEASRAPLVLYRLTPLSAAIVACVAFGQGEIAKQIRGQQIRLLPGITDCPECHGKLLGNEQPCRQCGNPMWKHAWLTAV